MTITLSAQDVAARVAAAIPAIATTLRPDAREALATALAAERSSRARGVLEMLLDNAEVASKDAAPLCQDTGTVWVRLEVGSDVRIEGDLQSALDAAVADAYRVAHLRMSTVTDALLDRTNPAHNGPVFLDVVPTPASGAVAHVMLKGGGSDNASRLEMLAPGAGWPGIKRVVLEAVNAKAESACPPLLIGVGVGATFDKVGALSKRALLREIGSPPPVPQLAALEAELLAEVNATGIGPGGTGGDTTALAVHIVTAPSHIAALPVAVNLGCSAVRSASIPLGPQR